MSSDLDARLVAIAANPHSIGPYVWRQTIEDCQIRIAELEAENERLRGQLGDPADHEAENKRLRVLLACAASGPQNLYTDDGCLHDNTRYPFIDYHGDPDEIEAALIERARTAAEQAKENKDE